MQIMIIALCKRSNLVLIGEFVRILLLTERFSFQLSVLIVLKFCFMMFKECSRAESFLALRLGLKLC